MLFPDTTHILYTLGNGNVYFQSTPSDSWHLAKASISTTGPPVVGTFTLLSDSIAWTAGFVTKTFSGMSRGFSYRAKGLTSASKVVLDSVTYNDVIVIQYTAESGGVDNTTDLPQYLIYFERNIGPIRIERTENGTTVVSKLVKIY
jgi:hypothetical protein